MQLLKKLIVCALLLGGGMWLGTWIVTTNADSIIDPNQPGSANDPVVTKSYVDEKIAALIKEQIGNLSGGGGGSAELIVETLKAGETLYAQAGTEFIVRNGKTIAVSDTTNGIPDVTGGIDIAPGSVVELNHLLLFPREGRGIQHADKETSTVIVMVRGGYIKVAD